VRTLAYPASTKNDVLHPAVSAMSTPTGIAINWAKEAAAETYPVTFTLRSGAKWSGTDENTEQLIMDINRAVTALKTIAWSAVDAKPDNVNDIAASPDPNSKSILLLNLSAMGPIIRLAGSDIIGNMESIVALWSSLMSISFTMNGSIVTIIVIFVITKK
jgi:hypothetical protein